MCAWKTSHRLGRASKQGTEIGLEKMRISQGPYKTTAATQPQKPLDRNRSKCNKLTTHHHNARTGGKREPQNARNAFTHRQSFGVWPWTTHMERVATLQAPHFNHPSSNKHRAPIVSRNTPTSDNQKQRKTMSVGHNGTRNWLLRWSVNDSVKATQRACEFVSSKVFKLQALVPTLAV